MLRSIRSCAVAIRPAAALKAALYLNAAALGVAAFLHYCAPAVVVILTMGSGERDVVDSSKSLGLFLSSTHYTGEQVRYFGLATRPEHSAGCCA